MTLNNTAIVIIRRNHCLWSWEAPQKNLLTLGKADIQTLFARTCLWLTGWWTNCWGAGAAGLVGNVFLWDSKKVTHREDPHQQHSSSKPTKGCHLRKGASLATLHCFAISEGNGKCYPQGDCTLKVNAKPRKGVWKTPSTGSAELQNSLKSHQTECLGASSHHVL